MGLSLNSDGLGTYTLAATLAVGDAPVGVLWADLNGDGNLDIATANVTGTNVSILLATDGTGTNYSAATNFTTTDSPYNIYAGDLDGDGDLDLVTANYSSSSISVLLNNGT